MKGQGVLVAITVAAVLIGALLLKGLAQEPPADPTASTSNGAPAGWLALALLLDKRGVPLEVRRSFRAEWPEGPALVLVPPAEVSGWSEEEVSLLLERVRTASLEVVLVCDEDPTRNRRLAHWWSALDVDCAPVAGAPGATAHGTMPAYPYRLFVRGRARAGSSGAALAVPAYVDDDGRGVVLRRPLGAGYVTVLSSSTLLANDGLAEAENAALLLSLVPAGGRVVVDESHHQQRGADVIERAFDAPGPKVGAVALLLLVPFVLLGFAPRRGDPPPSSSGPEPAAARAEARALAALYDKAGVTPPRSAKPLDPAAAGQRRSAHD